MRVGCVLIPYFAVRLERRDRPELRRAPLVVGGAPRADDGGRSGAAQVQDCSPDARRAGVQPGMPLRRALALCHGAAFVEARPSLYADTLAAIVTALEDVVPRVELEPGETAAEACVYLDLAGMQRLWPDERALAVEVARVTKQACGLTAQIGIGDGRAAARAAGSAPPPPTPRRLRSEPTGRERGDSLDRWLDKAPLSRCAGEGSGVGAHVVIIPPGHTSAFLATLPLTAIALPHDLRDRLQLLGIRTLGALAALPGGAVAAQFGPAGVRAWETAHGIDTRPFVTRVRHASVTEELEFPAPTVAQEAILASAHILLRRLLRRPEIGNRLVRRLAVRCADEAMGDRQWAMGDRQWAIGNGRSAMGNGQSWDGDAPLDERPIAHCPLPIASSWSWSWDHVLQEPSADPDRMLFLLRHKLEASALPGPVQRLSVTLAEFCGERGRQAGLFAPKGQRTAQLEEAIRQLRIRYHRPPVLRVLPVEPWSRIPERRLALAAYEC